jgi:hypothetical protein
VFVRRDYRPIHALAQRPRPAETNLAPNSVIRAWTGYQTNVA